MSDQPEHDNADKPDETIPRKALEGRETAIIPTRQLKRKSGNTDELKQELGATDEREIILVIRGIIERFVIPADRKLIIGRSNVKMRFVPDIDLTPYGALDRGVSRQHAHLWIEDEELYIEDNGSTNGTFLNARQLAPNTPAVVSSGNEIRLGRLSIQVLFR